MALTCHPPFINGLTINTVPIGTILLRAVRIELNRHNEDITQVGTLACTVHPFIRCTFLITDTK